METKQLPDLPSALLRVALADLEAVEAQPDRYRVEMGTWHEPDKEAQVCLVCMAGAVMAKTLGISDKEDLVPAETEDENKLNAINEFRIGLISHGLSLLDFHKPLGMAYSRHASKYHEEPKAFKQYIRNLIAEFEAAGI